MTNPSTDLTVTKQATGGVILRVDTDAGLNHAFRISQAVAQSGFFKDSAQAIMVKMLAGQALGIDPLSAVQQIHTIDRKLSYGATLISALIRRSGLYRFRQLESTDKVCRLEFYSRDDDGSWMSEGVVSFTIEEAQQAKLSGKDNWKGYPQDMLFARALARGARRFCADVFSGGSIYTPDELGSATHHESVALTDAGVEHDATPDVAADDVVEVAEFDDVPDDDPLGGGDSIRLRIPVTGSTGKQYEILVYHAGDWDCSCPARTQECRHVQAVRRPFPGGSGWLWPGDAGYDAAPPAGASVPVDATGDGDADVSGTSGLLAYARDLGIKDTDAMLVIAQAGGPDKFDACRGALDAFAEKREAAAQEAGEAA